MLKLIESTKDFVVTGKRKKTGGGMFFALLILTVCLGGAAYYFMSGLPKIAPVEADNQKSEMIDLESVEQVAVVDEIAKPEEAVALMESEPEVKEVVAEKAPEPVVVEEAPEPVILPVSNGRVPVVRAKAHQLAKPEPFLEPYLGNDIEGIEGIVKEIRSCRDDWRKAAEKRIEKHRKEDLHIKIVGRNGRPYADEKVRVRLLKHKFHFGVAIKKPFFSDLDKMHSWERKRMEEKEWIYSLDERYKLVGQFATQVGFANAFKYRLSAGNDHSHMIEDMLPRLRKMGLSIRGHTLIWPGWGHMHKDALELKDDPDALRAYCEKQIVEYAQLWDVDEWDVMNEPRANHDVQDLLGEEIMAEWFRIAQDNVKNEGAGLYVNDYKVISMDDKSWNRENIEKYRTNVDTLLRDGAPLTHLGFQNRYHSWISVEEIYERLEIFRDYGLPMKSTEFEIRDSKELTFTEEERAQYTADIMTVWFSHDLVNGIMAWTFFGVEGAVDDKTGKENAFSLLYNSGIKLNGKIWLYLMHNHWHTDEVIETNAKGIASVRGFLGDYEVLVRDGGTVKRAELTLDKEKNIYKIEL